MASTYMGYSGGYVSPSIEHGHSRSVKITLEFDFLKSKVKANKVSPFGHNILDDGGGGSTHKINVRNVI